MPARRPAFAPEVRFAVDIGEQPSITVTDNGPGIAAETITAILDYTTRTSSREAYVSPTRGAQGNALKTILAMPYRARPRQSRGNGDREPGRTPHHRPLGRCDAAGAGPHPRPGAMREKNRHLGHGAVAGFSYSQLVSARARFLQIAYGYALLNPHASIQFAWADEPVACYPALVPDWTKWGPSDPTSAHWYDAARFERLVAAYASQHGARTVREFVTEFRGLSGSAKVSQVLQASGLARTTLADLFDRNGKPDPRIRRLLREMQARSNPVKPRRPRRDRARAFPRPVRARSAETPTRSSTSACAASTTACRP